MIIKFEWNMSKKLSFERFWVACWLLIYLLNWTIFIELELEWKEYKNKINKQIKYKINKQIKYKIN